MLSMKLQIFAQQNKTQHAYTRERTFSVFVFFLVLWVFQRTKVLHGSFCVVDEEEKEFRKLG
jgi:hypothetical protein